MKIDRAKRVVAGAVLIVLSGLLAVAAPAHASSDWQQVGKGITGGVSGLALTASGSGAVDALIIRDNKSSGQNRAAAVHIPDSGSATVKELTWSGSLPSDLEALDAVPGQPGQFVALASSGTAYLLTVTDSRATVVRTIKLPSGGSGANYEGFALAVISGKLVAVWADRGQDQRPGVLYGAEIDLGQGKVGTPVSAKFTVPYPASHVRHVSDVKIGPSGGLLISSASDNGDNGPFDSAVYQGGTVSVGEEGVRLSVPATVSPVAKYPGHKVEGLACVPGSSSGVLGTDDENLGGYVRVADFCRP